MPAKIEWTKEQVQLLQDGTANGLLLKELASRVGLSINSVTRKLDELSLSRRMKDKSNKLALRLRTASAETPYKRSKISLPVIQSLLHPPPWEREGYKGPPKYDDDSELQS